MTKFISFDSAPKVRIATAVLLMLGAFCLVLISGLVLAYRATQGNMVEVAARALFVSREQTVVARLGELFAVPTVAALSLAASSSTIDGDITTQEDVMLTLHRTYPQIANIKIGSQSGLYFTTNRITRPPDTRYYVPPADAEIAIVTVTPKAPGEATQTVKFRNGTYESTGEPLISASTTDVQKLEWYNLGRRTVGAVAWSSGVVSGRVGPRITFVSGYEGSVPGTIGIDVGHDQISRALISAAQSVDEHIVVFDVDGLCFGTSLAKLDEAEIDAAEQSKESLCRDDLAQDIFDGYKADGAFSGHSLTSRGREYYATVMPLEFRGSGAGQKLLIGIATPMDALAKPLRDNLQITLIVISVAMLLAVPVLLVYARRFARPIQSLRTTIDSTLDLDFSAHSKSSSSIIEIQGLIDRFRTVRGAFRDICRFVPEAHVRRIISTGSAHVFGERREVSLLMTDVTDFTTISEQLEPERLLKDMTAYFTAMTQEILARGGTVDKYVGDAIFSFWNGMGDQPQHPEACCRAGLRVLRASKALEAAWSAQSKWPWKTRVGLHCAEAVVGNIGSEQRIDFTVIGAAVNLSSRIEGLNKFYGTDILATDQMRQRSGNNFLFRVIDVVMPKGTLDVTTIHELMGCLDEPELRPSAADIDFVAAWDRAYAMYRQRDWAEALKAFEQLAALRPHDAPAQLYVARCKNLAANPPGIQWDFVERFNSK